MTEKIKRRHRVKKKIKELSVKHDTSFKLAKFGMVGVLNTAVGYGLYSFFIFLGFHYTMAALFSTVLGVLFNFKTTGVLVFGRKENKLLFRFIAVYTITYTINILLLRILNFYNVNMYLAGAILLIPIALLSFFLLRKFVFTKED